MSTETGDCLLPSCGGSGQELPSKTCPIGVELKIKTEESSDNGNDDDDNDDNNGDSDDHGGCGDGVGGGGGGSVVDVDDDVRHKNATCDRCSSKICHKPKRSKRVSISYDLIADDADSSNSMESQSQASISSDGTLSMVFSDKSDSQKTLLGGLDVDVPSSSSSMQNLLPQIEHQSNENYSPNVWPPERGHRRAMSHSMAVHSTPNLSQNEHDTEAIKASRSRQLTSYASLIMGPTMHLPQHKDNLKQTTVLPSSSSSEKENRDSHISDLLFTHQTNTGQSFQKEAEKKKDSNCEHEIIKHSFSFTHRRSINLYSPLKCIKGSRSLSDILTESQRSNYCYRKMKTRDSLPSSLQNKATVNKKDSIASVTSCPTSIEERISDVECISGDNRGESQSAHTIQRKKSEIDITIQTGQSKSRASRKNKQKSFKRSKRFLHASASVDDFLSVVSNDMTSPNSEIPIIKKLDSSPVIMESSVFRFDCEHSSSPSAPIEIKPIQRQKAVEISKSLDSGLLLGANWLPSPASQPESPCSFTMEDYESNDSPDCRRKSRDISEPIDSPATRGDRRPSGLQGPMLSTTSEATETYCSPNTFIQKLTHRFSMKRRRSKEKKASIKDQLRRGSSPILPMPSKTRTHSVDSNGANFSTMFPHGRDSITDSDRSSSHDFQVRI